MSSEDPAKLLSESTRKLAKAMLILGFETLETAQKLTSQASEFVQDLVAEAKAEQVAKNSQDKNAEESVQDLVAKAKAEQVAKNAQDENAEPDIKA